MTQEEIKQALLAFRPGLDREDDPGFAPALAAMRESAELRQWFEEQTSSGRLLRERFRSIPVPEGLRQQILSEVPVTRRNSLVVPRNRFAVLAAAIVLMGGLVMVLRNVVVDGGEGRDLETFRGRMVGAVLRDYRMTLESGDMQEVRSYLAGERAPADYRLPAGLASRELSGCGVLSWVDQRVSMICFRSGRPLDPGTKADVYLFVAAQNSVPNPPRGPTPEIRQVRTLSTASWSDGGKVYVLATEGDEALLKSLF